MKIYIGPRKEWIGPYQIAEKMMFWKDRWNGADHDQMHELGNKFNKIPGLAKFCHWVYNKRKRSIKIKVHGYDIWDASQTMAMIIVPMLKLLKDTKHGSPNVDDEDVPEELRTTAAAALSEEQIDNGETDENWFKRWDWALDEMIWTFEQHALEDWEHQFYSGEADIQIEKIEGSTNSRIVRGPNDTFEVDHENMKKHALRMENGRRLFAKYYNSLWN
jgi:hypothetical protein